jgi:hypothetical protein
MIGSIFQYIAADLPYSSYISMAISVITFAVIYYLIRNKYIGLVLAADILGIYGVKKFLLPREEEPRCCPFSRVAVEQEADKDEGEGKGVEEDEGEVIFLADENEEVAGEAQEGEDEAQQEEVEEVEEVVQNEEEEVPVVEEIKI